MSAFDSLSLTPLVRLGSVQTERKPMKEPLSPSRNWLAVTFIVLWLAIPAILAVAWAMSFVRHLIAGLP